MNPDPTKPHGEDEYKGDVIDGCEESEVETGALAVQPRCADVDEERDGVTDDADENDDRQNVNVQDVYDAVKLCVGLGYQQVGQLDLSRQVASGSVEADPKVFQEERQSRLRAGRTAGFVPTSCLW